MNRARLEAVRFLRTLPYFRIVRASDADTEEERRISARNRMTYRGHDLRYVVPDDEADLLSSSLRLEEECREHTLKMLRLQLPPPLNVATPTAWPTTDRFDMSRPPPEMKFGVFEVKTLTLTPEEMSVMPEDFTAFILSELEIAAANRAFWAEWAEIEGRTYSVSYAAQYQQQPGPRTARCARCHHTVGEHATLRCTHPVPAGEGHYETCRCSGFVEEP